MKSSYPFWTIQNNYVLNVNHIVWFQMHSDGTLTICLSSPGPEGDSQINVKEPQAIKDFVAFVTLPHKT